VERRIFLALTKRFVTALRSGNDVGPLCEIANGWYDALIRSALYAVAKAEADAGGAELAQALHDCGSEVLNRVVRTPTVSAMVFWEPWFPFAQGRGARLRRAVSAERARAGLKQYRGWTELGDAWFDGEGASRMSPRGGPFCIDHCSPYRLEGPSPSSADGAFPESAEFADAVVLHVRAASEFMAKYTQYAWQLTQCEIAVIVPIRESYFASSSAPGYPGRMTLKLPPNYSASPAMIASNIFHEAIHSFLYKIEAFWPFVCDSGLRTTQIESPWSGRQIPLPAYIHACFIWYALCWFWNRVASSHLLHDVSCRQQFEQASIGFRRGAVENLQNYGTRLNADVVELCGSMQHDIRSFGSRQGC
jgi:hypothetical protein